MTRVPGYHVRLFPTGLAPTSQPAPPQTVSTTPSSPAPSLTKNMLTELVCNAPPSPLACCLKKHQTSARLVSWRLPNSAMMSLSFEGLRNKYACSDVTPAASTLTANRRTKLAPSHEILTSAAGVMSSLKCSRALNCSAC